MDLPSCAQAAEQVATTPNEPCRNQAKTFMDCLSANNGDMDQCRYPSLVLALIVPVRMSLFVVDARRLLCVICKPELCLCDCRFYFDTLQSCKLDNPSLAA